MEKDIGKISKNDTTDIVIRIDDFADRKGVTIREFMTSERYTGFTKSGVKIPASDFKKFKEMINSITEEDLKEEPEEETEKEGKEKLPKEQATLDEEMPDY
ncbi:hypothetical protein ES703_08885 [subsurface metagenome]